MATTSVSERDANGTRRLYQVEVGRHRTLLADDVRDGHRGDLWRRKCDHPVELAVEQQLDRLAAEPRREDPVEAGRRPAAVRDSLPVSSSSAAAML